MGRVRRHHLLNPRVGAGARPLRLSRPICSVPVHPSWKEPPHEPAPRPPARLRHLDLPCPDRPPAAVLASIRSAAIPARVTAGLDQAQVTGVRRSLARWRAQLPAISPDGGLAAADRDGIRLLCPGDPGWPPGLDDLGTARPYALWVRGTTDLAACCEKSLSVVGARAASAYGTHVATELAAS